MNMNCPITLSEPKLVLLSTIHSFRVFCHWFCNHSYFGNVILVCILVSSAMLAAEDPIQPGSDRNRVSQLD